jgi:hypothetical protein
MSQYASKEVSAAVTRRATPDELWLFEQIERINQDASEMGNDAGYTQALTALVFELRRENQRRHGEAKVMRDLLGEAYDFVDPDQIGAMHLKNQIEAALRGGA